MNFLFKLLFDSKQARSEIAATRGEAKKLRDELNSAGDGGRTADIPPGPPSEEIKKTNFELGSAIGSIKLIKTLISRIFIPVGIAKSVIGIAEAWNNVKIKALEARDAQLKANNEFISQLKSAREGSLGAREKLEEKFADRRQQLYDEYQKTVAELEKRSLAQQLRDKVTGAKTATQYQKLLIADITALERLQATEVSKLRKKQRQEEADQWNATQNKQYTDRIQREYELHKIQRDFSQDQADWMKSNLPTPLEGVEAELQQITRTHEARIRQLQSQLEDVVQKFASRSPFENLKAVLSGEEDLGATTDRYQRAIYELQDNLTESVNVMRKKRELEYQRFVRDENRKTAEEYGRLFGLRSSYGTTGLGGMSFLARGLGLQINGR